MLHDDRAAAAGAAHVVPATIDDEQRKSLSCLATDGMVVEEVTTSVFEDNDDITRPPRRRHPPTTGSSCVLVSRWCLSSHESSSAFVAALMCTIVFLVVILHVPSRSSGNGSQGTIVPDSGASLSTVAVGVTQQNAAWRRQMRSLINVSNIDSLMKEFSRKPHIAGSERNTHLADVVADMFEQFGFDEVRRQKLPVLLMNLTRRYLASIDAMNQTQEVLDLDELNVAGQEAWGTALLPTNGFSGSGHVRGPIVWVNYGRKQDFDAIGGLNLNGAIVVVRYRKIFRGDKVKYAAERGAVGVIICHDPHDMTGPGGVYPEGPWANNATVQRGSVSLTEGDALTPTWPSEFGGPVISVADTFNESVMGHGMALPVIPVQPISYGNARRLLRRMGGGTHPLPKGWEATGFAELLKNGIGPGPAMVELDVQRDLILYNITNVFGSIEGSEEPDRAVMFGSHRDAWTYGAGDPISGHSILLEVARATGELLAKGWRPRRSVTFCSWDAEEWSIIGSTEFVETNVELLRQRAVAYMNLDVAVRGTEVMHLNGSPLLQAAIAAMGAEVTLPLHAEGNSSTPTPVHVPTLSSIMTPLTPPGSGTDHVGFIQLAGVPTLDCDIDYVVSKYEAIYHSNYDNYDWMSRFGDPGFHFHGAMAQFMGSMLLLLSDSPVVPLTVEDYAASVARWVEAFAGEPSHAFADFTFIRESAAMLVQSAESHRIRRRALEVAIDETPLRVKPLQLRAVNDVSMGLERVFIGKGEAESGQPWYLHVIFTPSAQDFYAATTMPIIADALRTGNSVVANFALGRIAQYLRRAATFLNSTSVLPPVYANLR